ncbi:MAG: hypothetical protein Fur0010_07600 [Bdellovibrio sp.]
MRFLLIFVSLSVWAQPQKNDKPNLADETPFEITQEIRGELETLKNLKVDEFPNKIEKIRNDIETYIEHKGRVCNGEFSTIVLTEKGDSQKPNLPRNKLSKEERKLCFKELKAIHSTYINNLFLARKNYLEFIHQKRTDELDRSREEAVKKLQKLYDNL